MLERLIQYEAVHQIQGWRDLRRRLEADRRCYAFFHPALPDEPLIFIEVALTRGSPRRSSRCSIRKRRARSRHADTRDVLLDHQLPGGAARRLVRQFPDQAGGRGSRHELPQLKTFATLSPIPGFGGGSGPKKERRGAAVTRRGDSALRPIPAAREAGAGAGRSGRAVPPGQWRQARAAQLDGRYVRRRHRALARPDRQLRLLACATSSGITRPTPGNFKVVASPTLERLAGPSRQP